MFTLRFDESQPALVILDQTQLPTREVYVALRDAAEVHRAIQRLEVRGAPAIGVAAAYGLVIAANAIAADDVAAFRGELRRVAGYLSGARPTAVNLSWAIRRMLAVADEPAAAVNAVRRRLLDEAKAIHREDVDTNRRLGELGLSLLRPGDGLLTHCNAGALATTALGTATAPMYLGHERGYGFRVFCDETRPLLQGARLTAYELSRAGMDVTLLCDGMAASLMASGRVNAVLTGCDRVAGNGDAANKIGTLQLAIAARHFGVPLYVFAPSSTLDLSLATGADIVIEQRAADEVTDQWYRERMTADGVKVYNPSFDVTPSALISAIVTERGIARPPYPASLAAMFDGARPI